jgi:O-acetylserine/cysteine efflux transporter
MRPAHLALAVLVAAIWGLNFVVIEVGLDDFPPLLLSALRYTLASLPLLVLGGAAVVPWKWVLAVGGAIGVVKFSLLFVGMDVGMPAGLASLVLQAQVLFTIALAIVFLGERPRPLQIAGALVALAGIAVIGAGRGGNVPLGALALSIGAAASWGVGNICTRKAQASDAVALLVWASLIPPLPLAVLSVALGEGAPSIGVGGVLAVLYVVVGATFFGFGSWAWLMRRHPASRVVPFALLVPPVGIAAAWISLGEQPNAAELLGAVVVLAGLAITTSAVTTSSPRGTLRAWLPLPSARTTSSPRSPA